MLISEDRCSCALLVEQDGERTHLVFDDLGCLLDYLAEHPQTVVAGSFVHDYASGQWMQAPAAHYLAANPHTLSTPMGSGIVAFEVPNKAHAQQHTSGGQVLSFDQLTEVRRDWQQARLAQPSGTP
jgi:copper chaperone NosL